MKIKSPATPDDLLKMPKDGYKHELVVGEVVASRTGMYHSEVTVNITVILAAFVKKNRLGKVYTADVGIQLPNANVRSPDVTFVRWEKLPGGKSPESFGEIIPDLAVEVLSPHDSMRGIADKISDYLENGVPLIWLVDPSKQTVTVYRSLTETQLLLPGDTITGEPILQGFSCRVSEFFKGQESQPTNLPAGRPAAPSGDERQLFETTDQHGAA